jgi:hypothetical protein
MTREMLPETRALRHNVMELVGRVKRDVWREGAVHTCNPCDRCGKTTIGAGLCGECARNKIKMLTKAETKLCADILQQLA